MKSSLFYSIFIIFSLFYNADLNAQQQFKDKNNYVVLTKKIPQLQPIILTAEALKIEDKEQFGDFQVIICGKEIASITDVQKISSFIRKAEKAGVHLVACGFSLDKFNVDPSKVPKEIEIVKNGILYNFQLQKKGYKSLSL